MQFGEVRTDLHTIKKGEKRDFRKNGNSTFYALQHPQIWSNSERSLHKSVTKVKILLIYKRSIDKNFELSRCMD